MYKHKESFLNFLNRKVREENLILNADKDQLGELHLVTGDDVLTILEKYSIRVV